MKEAEFVEEKTIVEEQEIAPEAQKEGSFNFDPKPEGYAEKVLSHQNKDGYSGEWNKQGEKEGRGIEHRPDGSIYEGYWSQDMPNGRGRITRPEGETYEGSWKDGMQHGDGKATAPDGSTYDGQWSANIKQGLGKEVWPDTTQYEGNFEN